LTRIIIESEFKSSHTRPEGDDVMKGGSNFPRRRTSQMWRGGRGGRNARGPGRRGPSVGKDRWSVGRFCREKP